MSLVIAQILQAAPDVGANDFGSPFLMVFVVCLLAALALAAFVVAAVASGVMLAIVGAVCVALAIVGLMTIAVVCFNFALATNSSVDAAAACAAMAWVGMVGDADAGWRAAGGGSVLVVALPGWDGVEGCAGGMKEGGKRRENEGGKNGSGAGRPGSFFWWGASQIRRMFDMLACCLPSAGYPLSFPSYSLTLPCWGNSVTQRHIRLVE